MTKYGYARVSTTDQNYEIQREELQAMGCAIIRLEKESGKSREKRKELEAILQEIQSGDELWITSVDRLARSMKDFCDIVDILLKKGVALHATRQPIDISSVTGRAFMSMLAVFAEMERGMIRERQSAGIWRAKREGRYKPGIPKMENRQEMVDLAKRIGPTAAARRLGISRSTVNRAIREMKADGAI